MKAAFIKAVGPPENIIYGDLPKPKPAGRQALVRVAFVSVNPIDTYVRAGAVPRDLPFPYVIGADLAGTVEAVGPEARKFAVGQRVWGCVWTRHAQQGSFAEYVCVDEEWLYPLPPDVPEEQAAALALVGITAHLGLVREAGLKAGETLFVPGGTGGVGSTVVQMARRLGARVITTAGNEVKAKACLQLGADAVINYNTQDVSASLREVAPQGVQVWFDVLREPNLDLAVGALSEGGRMVVIAGRAARPSFPLGPFYVKCCRIHGFQMTLASAADRAACASDMNLWMSDGSLRARIDRVIPLSRAAEAHRLQEESTIEKRGTVAGKIVLSV